jgi:hypothetical protein
MAGGEKKPKTYGVESDVWSYGLSICELGLLRYPYVDHFR